MQLAVAAAGNASSVHAEVVAAAAAANTTMHLEWAPSLVPFPHPQVRPPSVRHPALSARPTRAAQPVGGLSSQQRRVHIWEDSPRPTHLLAVATAGGCAASTLQHG